MIRPKIQIILASGSPRRKILLKQMKLSFKVLRVDVDESFKKGEKPIHIVKRLSNEKLQKAIQNKINGIFITADTIVVLKGKVMGKPGDKKDAEKMLRSLSGNTHAVYTGFCVYNSDNGRMITDYEKTLVTFRKLELDEIRAYIDGGSPMDKAGAYGIQDDYGAVFIKKINGCYYNVVGLPLTKLYQTLLRII
jgi:septum formation protein